METQTSHRLIAGWLLLSCLMIFAMISLGGVTRLTGSGLSMVEWDPVFGFVPPMSEPQWQDIFTQYKASPEYQKINFGMNLEGFKSIYWFEFSHRVLGRLIGSIYLLPFLFFLAFKMVPRKMIAKLWIGFFLGGLQGLLGWYMVKSGLVDNPHVSQYRLTAHLGLALVIYGWLFWLFLDLVTDKNPPERHSGKAGKIAVILTLLVSTTILSGGFVAGLKAGFAYNTFPLMAGQWLPPAGLSMTPVWINLFENIATVQFNHRLLAIITLTSIILFALINKKQFTDRATQIGLIILFLAVLLQVSLGISTLLLHVPIPLAATHQAGAVVLLTAMLFITHRLNIKKPG
ncbi:MAG: COX15/CtaA family protein [Gammaproteobacteria bacterium]